MTPFLETLTIRTKDRGVIPFRPNWAQSRVIQEVERAEDEGRPARIIVLKARQLGISTVTEGLLFCYATTRPNTNAVVVAHDGGSSEHLFNITKHFYETWEYRDLFKTRYATKRQLTFDSNGSNVWVMTAEHTEAGRGRTIQAAHFSEMAFWTEPSEAMLAFNAAIPPLPGTLVIIESTANGMGNFFEEEWISAKSGQTDYVPLFFPWWEHYEYIPCQGFVCQNGTCDKCQSESKGLRPRDDEERQLLKLGCDLPHLAWRRWAVPNRCFGSVDMFHQEFPSTDDEAFLVSGVNAFPEVHLREVYQPLTPQVGSLMLDPNNGRVRFIEDRAGPLKLYKKPSSDSDWGQYFIGADPCYGTDPDRGGDWAAVQVINRHNHEQVATFHGRINPIAFADELAKLGRYFNNAMISVETDGPGYGTIGRLTGLYDNIWHHRVSDRLPSQQRSKSVLSWKSDWKRKHQLIGKLAETIERKDLILHDVRTYKELRGYTFYGQRGYGDSYGPAAKDQHDDLVMALGIAVFCESTEPRVTHYEQRPPKTLEDLDHVYGPDLVGADWDA